ncbi:O-methyltransferase [Chitinophaga niastensis]|uniref:O-methyltransferase n=1 Tax=Chitinophaga niastensis TaxID=536980 RepID=A0A2P8HCE4_CHINA|nr:class I SAM-dependent methyltransferase [Chitinophaga niastensis]PSL43907.1 O-methyltransferase [Chitinophaga niastensis]
METLSRKPFQGITNIIRFNWQYYVIAFCSIILLFTVKGFLPYYSQLTAAIVALFTLLSTVVSLIVSWYIYDYTGLYSLNWLPVLNGRSSGNIVNMHAGFDETSAILAKKYPAAKLLVFDFYDPLRHTEVSIERARKAYPAFPATKVISTSKVPLNENSADCICLIFSAHEIRNDEERVHFFQQLKNALRADGQIILVEHLRDINNFVAYNIGFLHFLSKRKWMQTLTNAGLSVDKVFKLTPFVSTYILKK